MDIQILLMLQNLRELTNGVFNDFFAFITTIAVDYYVLIPVLIIMWAIDKKKGIFAYVSYGVGCFLNAMLKSTFCVYRPWIRSDKLKPLESALSGASGYSFPSGHATSTSSTYLGIRKGYKKYKAINILCILMIVTTMFSRLFVGVHTPQDVLVGLIIGILSVIIVNLVEKYIDKNPNKDWVVLLLSVIICVIGVIYVSTKSYPMDYVDGKLLVDPASMVINSFKDPGTFFGVVIAWFIERRFINYDISGTLYQKIIRCCVGILLVVAYYTIVVNGIGKLVNINIVHFLLRGSMPIMAICIYPLFWKK